MVFGCSGQDGSLICHSLLKQGHTVIGFSRNNQTIHKNLKTLGIHNSFEIKQLSQENNLFSFERIIEDYQPDEIYNLAAQSSVGLSFKEPYLSIKSIYDLTLNILESARRIKYEGHIFFAGSSEIFGETKTPADIDHPKNWL